MPLFDLTPAAAALPAMPVKEGDKTAAKIAEFQHAHAAKVANIKKHLDRPPVPGEMFFLWTTAQFNTMTMIVWLTEQLGPIDELVISTYSISNICVNAMFDWFDKGMIRNIRFYLSDYIPKCAPKKYDLLTSQATARNASGGGTISIGLGFNHSKITLAHIEDNYIIITGSGNFAENSGNEQYTICNNEQIYRFYKDCICEDHPVRYRQDRLGAAR